MGGGSSSGPTLQQQQLETEQALTTANLNLEENSQRKSILNAMNGTRMFRGSALSRAVAGNTSGSAAQETPPPPASAAQNNNQVPPPTSPNTDLFTQLGNKSTSRSSGSGSTPAGGTGASGGGGRAIGGFGRE